MSKSTRYYTCSSCDKSTFSTDTPPDGWTVKREWAKDMKINRTRTYCEECNRSHESKHKEAP